MCGGETLQLIFSCVNFSKQNKGRRRGKRRNNLSPGPHLLPPANRQRGFLGGGQQKTNKEIKNKINKKNSPGGPFPCRPVDPKRAPPGARPGMGPGEAPPVWQPAAVGREAARSGPAQAARPAAEGRAQPRRLRAAKLRDRPSVASPRVGATRFPEARAGLSALSVTKDIAKNDLDYFFFLTRSQTFINLHQRWTKFCCLFHIKLFTDSLNKIDMTDAQPVKS